MSMERCQHPRVRIVAREEDSEFVECKECGEIFESSEFKDMIIEDEKLIAAPRPLRGASYTGFDAGAAQPAGALRAA